MENETVISLAAIAGLLTLAGCVLDAILRPIPILAPERDRRRRYAFRAALVVTFLFALLVL